MNEIFPRLTCYDQKIKFTARKSRLMETKALRKKSDKNEMGTIFFKSDIYDLF